MHGVHAGRAKVLRVSAQPPVTRANVYPAPVTGKPPIGLARPVAGQNHRGRGPATGSRIPLIRRSLGGRGSPGTSAKPGRIRGTGSLEMALGSTGGAGV
jgi:hypothetical protein